MAGLIKESVNAKLDLIVQKLFMGNRLSDRIMSVLDVKFVLNKTASILHPKIAHLYPSLSDFLSDYQADRNMLTVYGETPRDATDYFSPLEIFNTLYDYQLELEDVVNNAYIIALDEDDFFTQSKLKEFMIMLIPVTKQVCLLLDKAVAFNGDWMGFERDIENFIIL